MSVFDTNKEHFSAREIETIIYRTKTIENTAILTVSTMFIICFFVLFVSIVPFLYSIVMTVLIAFFYAGKIDNLMINRRKLLRVVTFDDISEVFKKKESGSVVSPCMRDFLLSINNKLLCKELSTFESIDLSLRKELYNKYQMKLIP